MPGLFKQMIEQQFFDDIYNAMSSDIHDNYNCYDLESRARDVQEVLAASLEGMEILRIHSIEQDSSEVTFKVLVSCDIEIEDYAYGEKIDEGVCQWFELSCGATLDKAGIDNIYVDNIVAFNK